MSNPDKPARSPARSYGRKSITVTRAPRDLLWALNPIDLRPFGVGPHRNVDDTPTGGGAGMVLRPDVVGRALDQAGERAHGDWPVIYLSPRGRPFDQAMAHR